MNDDNKKETNSEDAATGTGTENIAAQGEVAGLESQEATARNSDTGNNNGTGEFADKTVSIRRVSKVVKGGRRFGFSALVVTGDGRGRAGIGLGKAAEVPDALRKASEQARKSVFKIPLKGTSIPHEVLGKFGPSQVVMKPAAPGTGVIAGSAVRAIVEAAGIKDIRTKCIGSNNPHNVLSATISGFKSLKNPEDISKIRGLGLDDITYQQY